MSELGEQVKAAAASHVLNVVFGVVEAGLTGWMLFMFGELVNAFAAFPVPLGVFTGAMGFTGFLVGWFARGFSNGAEKRASARDYKRGIEAKVADTTPRAREKLRELYLTDGCVADESDGMMRFDDDFDMLGKRGLAERFGNRLTGQPQMWRMPADVRDAIRSSRKARETLGI